MASVCACGEFFHVDDNGELCLNPGSTGLRERLIYTEGTHQWRREDYPWLARLHVRVQAAGGGSAGGQAGPGTLVARAGGAGGGYSESLLTVDQVGGFETIIVGDGGTAGIGNNDGGPGGNSSFGGLIVANGGAGSPAEMAPGDTPEVANGVAGPPAGTGQRAQGGGAGEGAIRLNAAQGLAGAGGESVLGHGGFGRSSRGGGSAPRGRGGGAGGAQTRVVTDRFDGAPGGPGLVIVDLYA